MKGQDKNNKIKLAGAVKIAIAIVSILTIITLYNTHQNSERAEYARDYGCEWVIYSGYELCK